MVSISKIKTLFVSNSRSAKAGRNSLYMLLIKGISIGISFLYVPLLINALDTENYGVWLTLTSLVAWVSLFDIGIGNGLRNKLSQSISKNDFKTSKEIVSTAYVSMLFVVLLMDILFLCLYKHINWNSILVNSQKEIPNLTNIVLIVFSGFFCQFFLGLINSILYAVQKAALSSLVLTLGQIISFVAVFISVKWIKNDSMLFLASIIAFVPPIILLGSSILMFKTNLKEIRPSFRNFKISMVKDLFLLGIQFFIIQVITILLFQSNNIIITHVLNSQYVVEYNISYKYMSILTIVFNILATPLWSATTDAWEKKDLDWIKLTNRRLLKIAFLLSAVGIIMLICSSLIYTIWIHNDVDISFTTTFLLLTYSILMMLYGAYGYILNGIGKLRIQIIATLIIAISYIPLSYTLGKYMGLSGILLAFSLSAGLNVIWSKIQFDKLMNGKAYGIWAK